jgi:hypothetical protein
VTFDQDTVVPVGDRYQVWQITIVNRQGVDYISLAKIANVNVNEKFTVSYGNVYSNTSWYKAGSGYFSQIPLLTATLDTLYYQDGTDPGIFGQIRLIDQENSRVRIAGAIATESSTLIWFRPWLMLAGLTLGAATAIKWSGLYLLAAIGLYVVFSELALRRNAGEKYWLKKGLVSQGLLSFVNLIPPSLGVYLTTWLGWINTSGGYSRNWAESNSLPGAFGFLPNWAQSLWSYHEAIYKFHIGLSTEHSYQSHPLNWLLGIRPTAFFYETYPSGQMGCELEIECSMAITALGNPLIWVSATVSLIYLIYRYFKARERVVGLVLLGVAALYLPWLLFPERTVFQFYAVSFQPWMILALVLALQVGYRVVASSKPARARGFLAAFFVLALALSLFFLPINIGILLPFEQWQIRMWLPSWI